MPVQRNDLAVKDGLPPSEHTVNSVSLLHDTATPLIYTLSLHDALPICMPHDLSHLGFLAGQIGRLITISTTPVIAGDSFEMDAVDNRSRDRKSGSAGMPRPTSYAVFCLKKKTPACHAGPAKRSRRQGWPSAV